MSKARKNADSPPAIDLNADAGESFGAWRLGADEELFPLVTSVNLACGFHAGDPSTMRAAVRLAKGHGVAVGAHPGHRDLAGFGRRALAVSADEAFADTLYQAGALAAFLHSEGMRLHHVKPHGALYLQMLQDDELTSAVAAAVIAFDPAVPLVVLAGTAMEAAAEAVGATTVPEAFPDRGYLAGGLLAPRHMEGALVHEPQRAAERAVRMACGEPIEAVDGGRVTVTARTLCIHGDGPRAVETAQAVRAALDSAGVAVRTY